MKVAIYCRVSTEDQRERETIATQRDHARRHCESRGHVIHDIYEDDGVSSTKHRSLAQRPAGSRLLRDAQNGLFDAVLVYKLDRLGRIAQNILEIVEELQQFVRVESMTEPFDFSTASGKLFLALMAGTAQYERDTFVERSTEATNRLAKDGQWMGGIVPYGYRQVGFKRESRIAVSEELIDGLTISEADVIRLIYRLSAEEGWSCNRIADHLNELGVPTSYKRDERKILRGKRKENTRGIWLYGRIGDTIKRTTYKGIHFYGVRSQKKREVIERQVPAIVSPELWEKAQETLRKNFLFNASTGTHKYLLRGLIKCAHCGLTYVGICKKETLKRHNIKLGIGPGPIERVYYYCNGKQNGRSRFLDASESCPSIRISGQIEDIVMSDILDFLRQPGQVLAELQAALIERQQQPDDLQTKLARLRQLQKDKEVERERLVTLMVRGRIDDELYDKKWDAIRQEEAAIEKQVEAINQELHSAQAGLMQYRSLESLLHQLRYRLDGELTWEMKRKLVETLVESITIETREVGKEKCAKALIVYRFDQPEEGSDPFIQPTNIYTDVRAVTYSAE